MPPGSRRECSLFELNNEKETERAGDFTLTIRAEISNVTVALHVLYGYCLVVTFLFRNLP